jgi:xanthine dehydrogenase YagR molybdenum-binding subunit
MTDLLEPRAVGRDVVRRDGELKVRGTAPYAFEASVENPAFCHPVQATVARGTITAIDPSAAEALHGVLAVLTHENAERLASTQDEELAILQGPGVAFRGQLIGVVIAETSEIARQAADLVQVSYDQQPHDTTLSADRDDLYAPKEVNAGHPTDTAEGDVAAAMSTAPITLERTYTTAMYHDNPLEPHATTARWDAAGDGFLTVWESSQSVHSFRATICKIFALEQDNVQVICPYIGGGFGAKGTPHANLVLAVLAARVLPGRAVKLQLTRQQMFSLSAYRTPTIQRVQLAADTEGHLSAIALDVVEQTSKIKEFAEQTGAPTRMMYAAANRRTTHRLAALDVPVPSWFRAPGECPGMFGPEVAMDELAEALGIDPVELRIINEPEVDPETKKPWSSRQLVECLREGAQRFGWTDRTPRGHRDGDWLVGTGVASSVYPALRIPVSTATIRFEDGRYVLEIGSADLGTGAWTVLPQIAADALGVGVELVEARIGDTKYPMATVAGGSSGTATWGTAAVVAARSFREKFGTDPVDGDAADGSAGDVPVDSAHAKYAFGAQFAEVRVNADTGELRVPRLIGVFAAGRIINPRTARSQFIGAMTMGLSMALHEVGVFDNRVGQTMNHDLGEYHVTVNADVGDVQAHWLDEHDPWVGPLGSKGIGEIGITGTAAAISNAVHHATGVRVRDLPITLDKLLSALD